MEIYKLIQIDFVLECEAATGILPIHGLQKKNKWNHFS